MAETDKRPDATTEWVLVPRVPTEAMLDAGWIDKEDVSPQDIYGAMLDAAPPAPRLTAERDRLAEAARKAARVLRHDIGSATRAAGALTILEEALSSFSLPPSSLAAPEKEGPCDCDKKQTKIVPDK